MHVAIPQNNTTNPPNHSSKWFILVYHWIDRIVLHGIIYASSSSRNGLYGLAALGGSALWTTGAAADIVGYAQRADELVSRNACTIPTGLNAVGKVGAKVPWGACACFAQSSLGSTSGTSFMALRGSDGEPWSISCVCPLEFTTMCARRNLGAVVWYGLMASSVR